MSKLLLIDGDAHSLASLSRAFRLAGHDVVICDSARHALDQVRSQRFDMILSDVVIPGSDGLSLLADLKALGISAPVVMISGQANVEMAARATRLGALDFLEKPISTDRLLVTVENAVRLSRLEEENRRLRQRVGKSELVWQSISMQKVIARMDRVAHSDTRVYIFGETGTGKELIARTLHDRSARRDAPFITLNCAAVPAEIIDSELLGHEEGSFTGASARHIGKFEQASGGTLFLDEIGDMAVATQAKLLRVLEQNGVQRIGGDRTITVNVRLVVATQRNLEDLMRKRLFSEDLYHRIFVFPLTLPPLRERTEDIPLLTDYFARTISRQNDWKPQVISAGAYSELQRYSWPGNIRELRNVVERLLLLAGGEVDVSAVRAALGSEFSGGVPLSNIPGARLFEQVESFERGVICAELKRRDFRMTDTARALGLERSHLYKKCQHLGIDHKAKG